MFFNQKIKIAPISIKKNIPYQKKKKKKKKLRPKKYLGSKKIFRIKKSLGSKKKLIERNWI